MGVAYANLRLLREVLLTYLPTFLIYLSQGGSIYKTVSQYYDGDNIMCNSSYAYFCACCNSPTRVCKSVAAFIFLLHKKPQLHRDRRWLVQLAPALNILVRIDPPY